MSLLDLDFCFFFLYIGPEGVQFYSEFIVAYPNVSKSLISSSNFGEMYPMSTAFEQSNSTSKIISSAAEIIVKE